MHPNAANALYDWYEKFRKLEINSFNELKSICGNASIIKDDRVVFNIMGNKFRLVVRVVFEYKAVQIKWFGTHSEYDKIDVDTVIFKK
ncbi:type II toxin-antitoxin system HigB family toxin [Algoriphagus alkaliphilus]|nr:type II toxin-antitoxin system HigB family toxin [Algoriphagus alkaliphilus]